MRSGRTKSVVKQIRSARARFERQSAAAETRLNRDIADIKPEIDAWLAVNTSASEKYEAGIKPYQVKYEAARSALQALYASGVKPDSDSPELAAAKEAVAQAEQELSSGIEPLRQDMFDAINAERDKVGSEKLKRFEDASRAADKKKDLAQRRFEIVAERIAGHLGVERAYRYQLAQLKERA